MVKRYELTADQRKRCLELWHWLQRLGVEAGTPEKGKKWWNWNKHLNWLCATYNAITGEMIEPRHVDPVERLTKEGFILRFWESIMMGLFNHGYPCTLKHAIRYYVLTPGLDDWDMSEEERNNAILFNLYKHPEYV